MTFGIEPSSNLWKVETFRFQVYNTKLVQKVFLRSPFSKLPNQSSKCLAHVPRVEKGKGTLMGGGGV